MRRYSLILLLSLCCSVVWGAPNYGPVKGDAEQWVEHAFRKGAVPPFSFNYGGRSLDKFIKSWEYSKKIIPSNEYGRTTYMFTYSGSGLLVTCTVDVYQAFDAVRWKLEFKNISNRNSKQITQQRSLDARFSLGKAQKYVLHGIEGNNIARSDFFPKHEYLETGGEGLTMMPKGGRSSDGEFPFWNIEAPEYGGMVLAVGWTGSWLARMERSGKSEVSLQAGLRRFDSYLEPDESFSTPSVCLLFWDDGDYIDGCNRFRRFLLTHICRKIGGKYAEYPLSCSFNYRDPYPFTEYSGITELWARAMAQRYIQFGIHPDLFWMDAGWHEGASDYQHGRSWANTVGNWQVDSIRFPRGLKPVSETVHSLGAKFMIWFEPERVMLHTKWANEHPEFLLEIPDSKDDTYRLFDLSNPKARRWMTDQIVSLIKNNGVDYYRQDFNMDPAKYWEANEREGRIGMKEVRYIEGLYAFWDELLAAFPEMLIDNCASGGKRLDLETIGRSAPLWRTDYYHIGDPEAFQGQTVGLSMFLPIHGTGTNTDDPYLFRSCMSSAMILNWKVTNDRSNIPRMQKNVALYRTVKPYYYEDFYPLSDLDSLGSDKVWVVYEMHRPSDDSAVLVAFRRTNAEESDFVARLRGLENDEEYVLTSLDDGSESRVKGSSLKAGYTIHLENKRSSTVIMIKRP